MNTGCSSATCFHSALHMTHDINTGPRSHLPLKKNVFLKLRRVMVKRGGKCVEEREGGAASFIISAPVKKLLAVSITSSSALLKLGCFQMCQPVFLFFFFYRLVKHNTADTLRQHHLAHPPPPPPPPPPAYRSITSGHLHLLSLISLHTHASASSSVTLHATVRFTSS